MTPALLIPGTLCDMRLFAPMLEHLDLQAVDAGPIAHPSVEAAAEAMLAAAPPRFLAIGFSLGGFVVLEMMRRAPERLSGAVLLSSNAIAMPQGAAQDRRDEVARVRVAGWEKLIDGLWPRYVAAPARDRDDLRALLVDMAEAVGTDRFAAQAEVAISRPDRRDLLATTDMATLLLHGSEDAMSPPERNRALDRSPSVSLVELAGIGHFLPLEAPERAAAALRDWLAKAVTP